MTRFRPTCTRLEDRRTPALSVFNLGGSLLLTGTPEAASPGPFVGWNEAVSVTRTTGDLYQVKDGPRTLGTYKVTRDLNLLFDSIDNDVVVDLKGGTFKGGVTIDLGRGDRDPQTRSLVAVAGGGGQVNGGLTVRGSSANEGIGVGSAIKQASFVLPDNGSTYYYEYLDTSNPSPVTVRGDVAAVGREVAEPFEDGFSLAAGSTVRGSVFTQRVTYTEIEGTVNRDVTALTNVPGGMGLFTFGTIGGNLYAEGGATEPGYFSYAIVAGEIRGNVTVRATGGELLNETFGTVRGNLAVTAAPGASVYAILDGTVRGSAVYDFAASAAGDSNTVTLLGGTVGGQLVVSDGAGDLFVGIGTDAFGNEQAATVRGGVTISAGGGTNTFVFAGALGSKAGGPVVYSGGTGADAVTVTGADNKFNLFVFVGGGDDTVTFGPDAKVKSALIVFSPGGTHTWTPPDVVGFPLTLIGY